MDRTSGQLTVFFQDPFWVGVFERIENGKLSVAKVTFGAEPKDYEIQEYIQKCYNSLKYSPAVETLVKKEQKKNPKRMQREAKKQMQEKGIGTKSQQALKLQQEQNKLERKQKNREKKEAEEARRFELKQQKKREKHKGH
ncbi:MAG: YjdF family protein [Agathobacter sp.]|nr:YjdF family protein [Agathobacter sp.]